MTASARSTAERTLRALVIAGVVWFFVSALLVRLWEPTDALATARAQFSDDAIAAAKRYLFFLRNLRLVGGTLSVLLAAWLVLSPRWLPWSARPVFVLAIGVWFVGAAIDVPLSIAIWAHRSAWAMTTQPLSDFMAQVALGQLIGGLVWLGAVLVVVSVLKRWPRRGAWVLGAVGAVFVVVVQLIFPVVIAPLFNTFTPIGHSAHAAQGPRLRDLVTRSGLAVNELYVVDGSRQGAEANAYVAGVLGTERVVLYDTLLTAPAAEVDSVLGHELGHWRHGDVWRGTLLGALGAMLMALFVAWLVRGVPHLPVPFVLFALTTCVEPLTTPLWTFFSRQQEAKADAFAIDLTGDARAFVEMERRLALTNFSELVPHPLRVLFSTHPPAAARIAMGCARQPAACDAASMDVELKLVLDPRDEPAALALIGSEPIRRTVAFFDTPDLALQQRGIIVRARHAKGMKDDLTVKLRGLNTATAAPSGAEIEIDVVGDARQLSASLGAEVGGDAIAALIAGSRPLSALLSGAQRTALLGVDADALILHGPFATDVIKSRNAAGFPAPVTLELWTLGDERIVELSLRCAERDLPSVRAIVERTLLAASVRIAAEQLSKTHRALMFQKR